MMDTPVTVKPGRTAFRSNIRPRIIKNQHELSSLLPPPTSAAPRDQSTPLPTNNDSTFRTPGGPASSSSSSSSRKPTDAASASLFSVLDRSGWSVRVEHAVNKIIREHSARQQDTSIYGDTNRMFNATLDAVIIIANGIGGGCNGAGGKVDISDEHLLWSEGFLRGVRDRYGNHPPNVRKLLGFIRHLWDEKVAKGSAGAADASQLFLQTYQDNLGGQANMTTRIPAPVPPPTV